MKKLPKEISQLPILNQLTLDKNKLKALPAEIKALTRLNYFSYGNNPLDKIAKARTALVLG